MSDSTERIEPEDPIESHSTTAGIPEREVDAISRRRIELKALKTHTGWSNNECFRKMGLSRRTGYRLLNEVAAYPKGKANVGRKSLIPLAKLTEIKRWLDENYHLRSNAWKDLIAVFELHCTWKTARNAMKRAGWPACHECHKERIAMARKLEPANQHGEFHIRAQSASRLSTAAKAVSADSRHHQNCTAGQDATDAASSSTISTDMAAPFPTPRPRLEAEVCAQVQRQPPLLEISKPMEPSDQYVDQQKRHQKQKQHHHQKHHGSHLETHLEHQRHQHGQQLESRPGVSYHERPMGEFKYPDELYMNHPYHMVSPRQQLPHEW